MKTKLYISILIFLLSIRYTYSQSSTLTPQGVMFPQMSTVQINALTGQAKGTMVFDNSLNLMKYWDGTAWQSVTNSGSGGAWQSSGINQFSTNSGNIGIGTNTPTNKLSVQTVNDSYGMIHSSGGIELGTYVGGNAGWIGTKSNNSLVIHTNNGQNQSIVLPTGQWGIGTSNPNPTAQLEVYSINKGFLPPRLTLTASDSPNPIASTPSDGTIVYNNNATALSGVGLYMWKGIGWVKVTTETCPAAYTNCNNNCVNLNSDNNNCRACGAICPGQLTCINGNCACPPGFTQCNNNCVNLNSDNNNCNACGIVCPGQLTCINGSCGCPVGYVKCGNNCVLTSNDQNNCGACGNVCPTGKVCVNGSCQ
jgi:hypothetical protein